MHSSTVTNAQYYWCYMTSHWVRDFPFDSSCHYLASKEYSVFIVVYNQDFELFKGRVDTFFYGSQNNAVSFVKTSFLLNLFTKLFAGFLYI